MITNRFIKKFALASAAILGTATAAYAVPVSFNVNGAASSVSIAINSNTSEANDPTVTLAAGLGSNIFDLDLDGGPTSASFDFFNLNVDPSGGFFGAGGIDADITATLAFSDPTSSASGGGDVSLTYTGFFAGIGNGSLTWDPQPANVVLADGTEFSVAFDSLSSITGGNNSVGATVTLLSGPAEEMLIPEPGTVALLAMGLIGVGLARRRRGQNG